MANAIHTELNLVTIIPMKSVPNLLTINAVLMYIGLVSVFLGRERLGPGRLSMWGDEVLFVGWCGTE